MENKMFCYQCQETAGNKGCTQVGVCGKTSEVANLQDVLIYVTKGLSEVLIRLKEEKIKLSEEDVHVVTENLFMTITNANFDGPIIKAKIYQTAKLKDELLKQVTNKNGFKTALWTPQNDEDLYSFIPNTSVLATKNEDVRSLRELVVYGLKGMAAYNHHANALGKKDEAVDDFMQLALVKVTDDTLSVEDLIALVLETGKLGVSAMALLDGANTSSYGNPEISKVNIGVRNNPAILISGHDLRDIEMLLEQTEGTGVDVYTHSEMLPAHYYPKLKKFKHLAGNYGNAWWQQKEEFEKFNGPILFTTNCIVPPKASYKDRMYTTGASGFEGCKHIPGKPGEYKDFSEIIEHAKRLPAPTEIEHGEIIGGFAHNQVFELADTVVEAIKAGAIKKFFVMAGCDGRSKKRSYYTEFAKALPKESIILTAGCAKYRYNKLNLGDIGGIPRVLDAGQCNDSYSLVMIALKLKDAFELSSINELPLVYNIAWYEQKAVIVLLALLYLGVKNIHLGPTLPAFLSPNVAKVLVETFGIASIGSVSSDIDLFFKKENVQAM